MRIITAIIFLITMSATVHAEMMLFVREDCPFCQELETQLELNNLYSKLDIKEYEIQNSEANLYLYAEKAKELGYSKALVPLLIDGEQAVDGKSAILAYLDGAQKSAQANTTLSDEESNQLNDIINDSPVQQERKTQTIGIIAIVFGLTLFSTIIYKARRKLRPPSK